MVRTALCLLFLLGSLPAHAANDVELNVKNDPKLWANQNADKYEQEDINDFYGRFERNIQKKKKVLEKGTKPDVKAEELTLEDVFGDDVGEPLNPADLNEKKSVSEDN